MKNSTEAIIISACQSGNTEQFTELYETYVQKIYSFVFHKTLHKETAEDLTSDIFLKAIDKIQSFNPKKASFQTWLFTLARNTVVDFWRSQREHKNIDDIWDLDALEDLESDADKKLLHEKLHTHLQKISAKQREVLMLRYWQDLSFKEIAEITGQSEASLKMSVSRSIKKLKGGFIIFLLLSL